MASRLLRNTRPDCVQKALRRADIKTTMRHYAHAPNDDGQAKAEVQGDQTASSVTQKLQGRSNLKLVG
jgi:hypothetical protein